ncbi:MAG: hypothetical protein HXS52_02100 [Theionarchaea archaeon]|nr:hypothetical protein [Theionarchaea archaeon]
MVDLLTRLNYEFEPVLKEIKRKAKISKSSDISTSCERVYVDDIDSFRKVRNVNPKAVKDFVPVKMSERKLKESLASIIGEKFIPEDWGGERSDLYSSRIILRGKRISTAFLLKGPSVRKLTIDKCGKRGNQVLRLMTEPAELFVVQHVGEIDTDVIKLLETCVSNLSGSKNMKLYYCVIDGTDTARILFAYSKLSIS